MSPHVGPAPSGYEDTYTSSLPGSSSCRPRVIVCAPQSVYTAFTCWMFVKGFAGSSLIVKTRTPSQPVGVPPADPRAPHWGAAIVRVHGQEHQVGDAVAVPVPHDRVVLGPSHAKSLTSRGAAGFEMSKIRTPPRDPVPGGNPASPV